MQQNEEEEFLDRSPIELAFEPGDTILYSDILGIMALLNSCFEAVGAAQKKKKIEAILANKWHVHYIDANNGRRVLSETEFIEHPHELHTAICLARVNYDIVFAPKGIFTRHEKKFDIYLLRDTIILKADLKHITSKNPDTIANRIKSGSDQASRVVIHINSDIDKRTLIDGLRSGVERNSLIKEILLFYKARFYRLPKSRILSKGIYDVLQ